MIKVYLAGYSGENEYRNHVIKRYGRLLDVFDPMREVDAEIIKRKELSELTNEDVSSIVEGDKAAIELCDIVVVYIRRASFGTAMEMIYAFKNKIPVYVIDPSTKFREDIWIRYHTNKFFDDIDQCFNHILDSIKGI